MKMNIFTIHEMYFTSFKYTFVRNTCIFDKDIFETGPIYPLYCEGVHSHSKQKPSAFSPYSLYFPTNPEFFSINKQWQLYVEKALE